MFKKIAIGSMVALSFASLLTLAPINQADAAKKKVSLKELNVQFVPSSQADTIADKVKPLESLLKKQLGIPVHVTISTDYNTIVEAMGSKKVDMGFLPPAGYVQANKQYGAKVILQSQRLGMTDNNTGENTDKLVNYYRAMVVVRKDSGINSIKDLKGKKIAVQDTTSDSGYMFPAIDLDKKGVNIMKNNIQLVTVKGHDQGVISVLNKDTDAAFIFDDARNIVKKDNPDVFKDTKVLMYTSKIPNDTISLRKGISAKDTKTIQSAMIKVAKSTEGKKVMNEVYSWAGVTKSKNSNFDVVRKYETALENLK
ncbi:MAG: phosphate/phosphite/phosphonate ABC transporter substrate-binding protein [Lactobacillaceae bacterium]|jgi:phosphonate transport system substrate-binding protein|nr:phosphate/phosphite/phosphonate ABC transporter substrate-binding protein [Lactobacillaceae bacterium]